METGKPALASAGAHMSTVAAQTERRMEVQAPLTALYIHTVPTLPAQPLPQPPLAAVDSAALHLTMPPLYSKETLPFLTLHIASGLQPGLSVINTPSAAKPKSSGRHLCPHCGRDCMKPSVLEKHLRCHTGERPYPCTVCGVSFKTQSNLYKHKRTQAHARVSSESEQSTLGSLDSISCSTETSSISVDERGDETVGAERDVNKSATKKIPVVVQTLENTEKISSQNTLEHNKLPQSEDKPNAERAPPINRHVALQRQEATLFSKQWETSVSTSKSQSHESTDSGFSESSELYHSPGSLLPDLSMDSLTETTTEHSEEDASQQKNKETKAISKEQENKSLEERITKLISQNSAVVEDKHLENVRPRKTVLSKQGSIDLPMPYTYKDSFHFDMRISKMSNSNRKPGLYNSVPTQPSRTTEHAPLIRSNSLPYSVSLLEPDPSCSTSSSYHRDCTLFRRGSSGQITPTGFSIKSVNQHSSTHRPLVRQAAVDCNHATDALFKNSSVEEACTSNLRYHSEAGDICGETSNRKCRRRKSQKFAYSKWYMYGGGTFKKLYEMERAGENSAAKGTKSIPNPDVIQGLQKRLTAGNCETTVVSSPNLVKSATVHSFEVQSPRLQLMPSTSFNSLSNHILASPTTPRMPLRRNLSLSVLPLSFISLAPNVSIDTNKRGEAGTLSSKEPFHSASQSHENIPSDRKKQRTDNKFYFPEMKTDPISSTPHTCSILQPNLNQINTKSNSALFPSSTINVNASLGSSSPAKSTSTTVNSSFMPKYQLKLPNLSDSVSSPLIQAESKPKQNDIAATLLPSLTSSSAISKTSNSTRQNVDATKNNISITTQSVPNTSNHINVISPVVHHCPVADTKTTSSLRNSHVGHFSTMIQSPSFGSIAPITAFTPIHRTKSSPAAFTLTQQQLTPQKSPLTPQPNTDTNIPVVPMPDQQTTPKVFHVQTADLQICFQIISDEQLALIEPQIEKQTDSSHLQTLQVPASANEVRICTTLESTDKEISHRHSDSNSEVGTLTKDSSKPAECDKPETQLPTANYPSSSSSTQPQTSCPSIKVETLSSSMKVEVSIGAPSKEKMLVKSRISQKVIEENIGEPELQSFSKEDKPCLSIVTCTSHCPGNNSRTDCDKNCATHGNEDKTGFGISNKSAVRSNLQLSMVPLSLSQTNPASEMERLSGGSTSSHAAVTEETDPVFSLSADEVTAAASINVPNATGSKERRSSVGRVDQESDSGVQQSLQKASETCTEGVTSLHPNNMQAHEVGDRANSTPHSWSVGEPHLLHLSQTQSGMCPYPLHTSGRDPNLQYDNNQLSEHKSTLLQKTNSYLPQNTDIRTNISQTSVKNAPQSQTVSKMEIGCQDGIGLFREQNQRKPEGAEINTVNSSTQEFTSQSHISEMTSIYQANSSVLNPPPRETSGVYSEHVCQDQPPEPCDKFPLTLFGVGNPFSYSPTEPLSGVVRVVQSSVDVEDSSSDDEGKLIIEL